MRWLGRGRGRHLREYGGFFLRVGLGLAAISVVAALQGAATATTLPEAVRRAVTTHPSVEASRANRRATGWDLEASRSRLLPRLDLSGDAGAQYVDQPNGIAVDENAEWRFRRKATVTVSQIVFDGWERANDVYRNAARLDAASLRVLERSEALGLDAVEAYIDVRRHAAILAIARQSRQRLTGILGLVRQMSSGGKAPRSDIDQANERIAAADTVIVQIEQALEETKAKYRQVVGIEAQDLQRVGYPAGLPPTREAAYRQALRFNPSIQASGADVDAAAFALEQAKSSYYPIISLEGDASYGMDVDGTPGKDVDVTGKVVLSWNIFEGFGANYREQAQFERLTQAQFEQQATERLTREAIDRAFAAYRIGGERVSVAQQQVAATNRVLRQYQDEYKLGKRSLLDLLDAESSSFNSQFQLTSAQAVRLFAAYQLMATMGRLLSSMDVGAPPESKADFVEQSKGGVFAIEIEPLRQ